MSAPEDRRAEVWSKIVLVLQAMVSHPKIAEKLKKKVKS